MNFQSGAMYGLSLVPFGFGGFKLLKPLLSESPASEHIGLQVVEVEGILLLLIGAVFFVGAAIVEAIHDAKKGPGDGLSSQPQE